MISTPLSPTGSGGRRRSPATSGATPMGLGISISLAACSATTSSRCDRRPGPTSGPTAIPEISTKGPASSWCRCSARRLTRGNGRKRAVPTSCLWAARAVRGSGRVADCSAATSDAAGPYGLSCTIKPVPRPTQGVAEHRDRQRYRARDGAFCRSPARNGCFCRSRRRTRRGVVDCFGGGGTVAPSMAFHAIRTPKAARTSSFGIKIKPGQWNQAARWIAPEKSEPGKLRHCPSVVKI